MLKIAAVILASAAGALGATASASSSSTLVSNSPWWEKITVTMGGDGKPEACRYETSLKGADTADCDVDSTPAAMATNASESKGEVTQITFERRFDPGAAAPKPDMKPGDTLLGGQVLALAIDEAGKVRTCEVINMSGEVTPTYGCAEARAERFQASMGGATKSSREGFMTILVYGHAEHMV